MKDVNRIGLIAGLALLFVVLAVALPQFVSLPSLASLKHALPWILFGLFWAFFWRAGGCCGRRGCRQTPPHDDSATAV